MMVQGSSWNPAFDPSGDVFGAGCDQKHVPVSSFLPELRIAIWQGCGARSSKRHKIVIGPGEAEHWAAHRARIYRGGQSLVEHPTEHLEISEPRFRPKFVEHRSLLILRHAIQRVETGKIKVGVDYRLPERGDAHQALGEILLAVARGQDASARSRADQDERALEPTRCKLLGEQRPHGMAEQHWLRRQRVEERREFSAVIGKANAAKLLVGSGLVLPVANKIGRVAGPPQALEHGAKFVEAPAAGRCAV